MKDGVKSTALIGKVLGEISVEVDFLDTIMANKYERQPEKRRAWESASRVERAAVRSKKEKPASAITPPPGPSIESGAGAATGVDSAARTAFFKRHLSFGGCLFWLEVSSI